MSKQYNKSAVATSIGNAEIDFTPPARYYWHVTQITISTTGSNPSTAQVFIDQKYFCGSAIGNGDSADGSALIVPNASLLRVIWSGASSGASCVCNIQVEENEVGS